MNICMDHNTTMDNKLLDWFISINKSQKNYTHNLSITDDQKKNNLSITKKKKKANKTNDNS